MSTFLRLWTKQFWMQYSEYEPSLDNYSLQIVKARIFIVLHELVEQFEERK